MSSPRSVCATETTRPFKKAESEEPPLLVRFTCILSSQGETAKDPLSVREVDAVLAQVRSAFRLIPRKHHDCSYDAYIRQVAMQVQRQESAGGPAGR